MADGCFTPRVLRRLFSQLYIESFCDETRPAWLITAFLLPLGPSPEGFVRCGDQVRARGWLVYGREALLKGWPRCELQLIGQCMAPFGFATRLPIALLGFCFAHDGNPLSWHFVSIVPLRAGRGGGARARVRFQSPASPLGALFRLLSATNAQHASPGTLNLETTPATPAPNTTQNQCTCANGPSPSEFQYGGARRPAPR